jgi:hypothetical protein
MVAVDLGVMVALPAVALVMVAVQVVALGAARLVHPVAVSTTTITNGAWIVLQQC